MQIQTTLLVAVLAVGAPAVAQDTELVWDVPHPSQDTDPYSEVMTGGQFSGSFSVSGPFDLDGDGEMEVLVSDFSGGQRIHVFEVAGTDSWEWVYSTPYSDDNVGGFGSLFEQFRDTQRAGFEQLFDLCADAPSLGGLLQSSSSLLIGQFWGLSHSSS